MQKLGKTCGVILADVQRKWCGVILAGVQEKLGGVILISVQGSGVVLSWLA